MTYAKVNISLHSRDMQVRKQNQQHTHTIISQYGNINAIYMMESSFYKIMNANTSIEVFSLNSAHIHYLSSDSEQCLWTVNNPGTSKGSESVKIKNVL